MDKFEVKMKRKYEANCFFKPKVTKVKSNFTYLHSLLCVLRGSELTLLHHVDAFGNHFCVVFFSLFDHASIVDLHLDVEARLKVHRCESTLLFELIVESHKFEALIFRNEEGVADNLGKVGLRLTD